MTFIPNSFDDDMAGLHAEPPEDDEPSAGSGVMAREYHYSPMTGGLVIKENGEFKPVEGWPGHHENMAEFDRLRNSGEITLQKTTNYGHVLFNGHSGRVDIYSAP